MGAWGYGPLANDYAADLMFKLNAHEVVSEALSDNDPHLIIGAGWLFSRVGYNLCYDVDHLEKHRDQLLIRLHEILENWEWLNEWGDPRKKVASINSLIKAIESMDQYEFGAWND